MRSLISFEFKKFFSKKRNSIVIVSFIALILIFVGFNNRADKLRFENEIYSIDYEIESIESSLIKINSEIERLPDNQALKDIKTSSEKEIQLKKELKAAMTDEKWSEVLQLKIDLDKNFIEDIRKGNTITSVPIQELENNIELNSILLEKNIKPIYTDISMEGFNFLKVLLNNPIMMIVMLVIVVMTGDVVSSEVENKTFKLLLTQPINKNKIFLSKVVSSVLLQLSILGSILFSVFVLLGITKGFGAIDYPIAIIESNTIRYIAMGDYLIKLIIIFVLFIIFITIASILISSLSKNTATSVSISIILFISSYMVINQGFLNKVAHLLPFTYVDLTNAIQGFTATRLKNYNITFTNGCIVLVLFSLFLLILNMWIFKRKDFDV